MRLFWNFFRVGVINELQYRVNFFIQIFRSLIALGTGLAVLALVFSHTPDLAGWTSAELLAVMGVHILMGGVISTFIEPNMARLMGDVQEGTLDFVLTKPADAQLLISVREVRIWQVVDIMMGAIVLGVGLAQVGQRIGLTQALVFALVLLCGAAMIYSFWLILTTGAFWLTRIDSIVELFSGVYQAGRWPVGIYPSWLRNSLTFLVPIAFAVTVPAETLTRPLDPGSIALAIGLAAGLLLFARLFWRFGLRNYSGASA